jgi:hypothetical protein
VKYRHPKDGHHCIPDELLDRPTMTLDDRLHPLEVLRQQSPKRLGIKPLTELG